jgi:hypothetical protein
MSFRDRPGIALPCIVALTGRPNFATSAYHCDCLRRCYLTAFIVTRNQWRDEMIKRGVARYNWMSGKWEWGEPPKDSRSDVMGSNMHKVVPGPK